MSIMVREVQAEDRTSKDLIPVLYVVIEGVEDVTAFKKLVQAGSCLEPNLSAAMKELADLVTIGKIQQPYREMPK